MTGYEDSEKAFRCCFRSPHDFRLVGRNRHGNAYGEGQGLHRKVESEGHEEKCNRWGQSPR
jgi:hypothetical protein